MKINPETLLFEDLNAEEAQELEYYARAYLFEKEIVRADWIDEWLNLPKVLAMNMMDVVLLVTIFPARAALSVLNWKNEHLRKIHQEISDIYSKDLTVLERRILQSPVFDAFREE